MASGVIVEVGARRFAVPYECPCCGAVPDAELLVPLTPTRARPPAPETAHAIGFPYCKRCLAHAARWDAIKNVETAIKVVGLLAGIGVGLAVHWAVGIGVFAASVGAAVGVGRTSRAKAKAACGEACAGPGIAVSYLGWSGSASAFELASHVYAARFAEQNAAKLVNASPLLRKVIEGHKLARLAIPTPAAAIRAVPAPASIADWIDRVQTAPGRVARLDWLARALDAITEPSERGELIIAATRLELAGIGDNPDQRSLQKAIVDVRSDNIPEELRDAIVRELEQRLATR